MITTKGEAHAVNVIAELLRTHGYKLPPDTADQLVTAMRKRGSL